MVLRELKRPTMLAPPASAVAGPAPSSAQQRLKALRSQQELGGPEAVAKPFAILPSTSVSAAALEVGRKDEATVFCLSVVAEMVHFSFLSRQ